MLLVLTPEEALGLIKEKFSPLSKKEQVCLSRASGRVLAADITASEYVPGFDRSTVDGYALRASDCFGCSEAIPALLTLSRSIAMGEEAGAELAEGCCAYVPTGAALPPGANAVAMIEYCEDFGDGTIGITKAVAPGENLIFKGDDVYPGKVVLPAGRMLSAKDIGSLAAMGIMQVEVFAKPLVGIISTGDELVGADETPAEGQVRDINSLMLAALVEEMGSEVRLFGIVKDEESLLSEALDKAIDDCDCVLISGGSSVGAKDATGKIIERRGELLFHGIAMKPGKPTILGKSEGKPIFGLPGHPGAAWFVSQIFVRAALDALFGREVRPLTLRATLTESVSANHGRAQYGGASLALRDGKWYATPIRSKSGLISSLCCADGFFCIPRDSEGCAAGEEIELILYNSYQEI